MSLCLLLANAAATWFMTGLIWTVQVVHYPLMEHASPEAYGTFHRRHMRRITWIVAPAMLVEAATALALLMWPPTGADRPLLVAGAVMVAALWISTAAVQVPLHNRLAQAYDPAVHRRLVRGNWLRTILWTARSMLLLVLLVAAR